MHIDLGVFPIPTWQNAQCMYLERNPLVIFIETRTSPDYLCGAHVEEDHLSLNLNYRWIMIAVSHDSQSQSR